MNIYEDERFKTLAVNAVVRTLMPLFKLHQQAEPDERLRLKEQARVKMVVNTVMTPGFADWRPETQLWLTAQLTKRLIATGWRPEDNDQITEFVQALYGLADAFPKIEPPSTRVSNLASMLPEMLRTPAIDMFRQR